MQHNRLSATSKPNAGQISSVVPSSWRPASQAAGTAASPHSSTPPSTTAAAASRGGNVSFTAATKLQQQQYVRHVQQDIPGSRQQSGVQPQPQWQGQYQVEARHRKGQVNSAEPVSSFQQLFSHDMTPTASSAAAPRLTRQQSQASSKGFGKPKARRSGGGSSAGGAAPSQPVLDATPGVARVRLCIVRAVEYGQNMRVTGSGPDFGSWNTDNGPKLKWNDGHKWTADITLAPGV